MLTDLCVYTIKHSDNLRRSDERGGRDTYTENKRWVRTRNLLDVAKRSGETLPVVFAPAEGTRTLFAWAILEEVVVGEKTTRYTFSNLRPFSKRYRKSRLKKASDGESLAQDFIRPYAICVTPSFLKSTAEKTRRRRGAHLGQIG